MSDTIEHDDEAQPSKFPRTEVNAVFEVIRVAAKSVS